DTYRRLQPNNPGYTCCVDDLQSQAAKPLNERIDYIFLVDRDGGAWKLVTADKVFDHAFALNNGWHWASDHVGLMIELQPGQAISP
ncbi:MAG TPA: hypothetical protein VLD65_02685, partial [Anaerolineales bacterium]|nr:hypothetical protein [Anaerolineales bacterium]